MNEHNITYFAAKGIDPDYVFERFTHAGEYCRKIEYYPNAGNGYQVNISAANFNKSLRKYLIDADCWELAECYFIELFEHCQPLEIVQIIQRVYNSIQSDLLAAEMYELFEPFDEAKKTIGNLFCKIANKE